HRPSFAREGIRGDRGSARRVRRIGRLPRAHARRARLARDRRSVPGVARRKGDQDIRTLATEESRMTASLVVTVVGPDRPGIVNQVSDAARRFDANWAGSRMASLAGQFAGIVHFEVADAKADALAGALRELGSSGLQVVIAR